MNEFLVLAAESTLGMSGATALYGLIQVVRGAEAHAFMVAVPYGLATWSMLLWIASQVF